MAAVNNVPHLVDKKGEDEMGGWIIQAKRLKSIIMSCLPDDIMESVISCKISKATWTDLVHNFEGQPNLKKDFQENSNDEVDERSSEEYLKDLDIEFHERALLAN
ncbi:hypothetical protein Tco_0897616 [Tanacetum coccineum]